VCAYVEGVQLLHLNRLSHLAHVAGWLSVWDSPHDLFICGPCFFHVFKFCYVHYVHRMLILVWKRVQKECRFVCVCVCVFVFQNPIISPRTNSGIQLVTIRSLWMQSQQVKILPQTISWRITAVFGLICMNMFERVFYVSAQCGWPVAHMIEW